MRRLWAALIVVLSLAPRTVLASGASEAANPVVAAVAINGALVASAAVIVERAGQFWVARADVAAWRIKPFTAKPVQYDGADYVPAAAIPGARIRFDKTAQRLDLTLPANDFVETSLGPARPAAVAPTAGHGAFLNYDVQAGLGNGPTVVGAYTESGVALGQGTLTSTATVGTPPGIVRLDTAFRLDDVARRRTLRIGDSISSPTGSGTSVPFAGIQLATNFATQPTFVSVPTPSLRGTVDRASTLELLLNGDTLLRADVPPGAFVVENLSTSSTSGDVQAVIRDANGHTQTITSHYLTSSSLLKSHVEEYSIDAGVRRVDYGQRSNAYAGSLFDATERRGFSDDFTASAHVEAAPGTYLASVGGTAVAARGVAGFDIGHSGGARGGTSADVNYSGGGRVLSGGFDLTVQSAAFGAASCGATVCDQVTLVEGAHLGVSLGRSRSLNLSASRVRRASGAAGSSTLARYNARLGPGTLVVAAGTLTGTTRLSSIDVQYALPLHGRAMLATGLSDYNGTMMQTAQFSKALPGTTGVGYDAQLQQTPGSPSQFDGGITAQSQYASAAARLRTAPTGTSAAVDVHGGVAWVGSGVYFAQSIGDGFGLVDLSGYPRTHVYVGGNDIGTTDAHGRILAPNLQPYQANQVRVDVRDLPFTAHVDEATLEAVPRYRSPVRVAFTTRAAGGITVTLRNAAGAFIPTGSTVSTADGKRSWPVADDGQTYIDAVAPGRATYTVKTPSAKTCRIDVQIPRDTSANPDIGTVVCR